jgi:hypothetical protein
MKSRAYTYLSLLAIIGFSTLPALADGEAPLVNTSTVQTTETQTAPPVVLDSYMKPVYSRTKEVSSGGETEKVVEPMIMERHETVAIPGSESATTTVQTEKTVVPTTVIKSQSHSASKVVVLSHPRHVTHIAHRRAPRSYVAMRSSKATERVEKVQTATRTTVNEERSVTPTTIIDRKDPALDNN